MKKRTLLSLLLCAIPVACLWEGEAAGIRSEELGVRSPNSYLLSPNAYLPQIDSDFTDLDVRDAQNNPVTDPSASQKLEALFRENLVNLTVFASPHAMNEVFSWLDSFSHLFNKLIFMRLSVAFGLLQDVFLPPSRRFVHNVHNLCVTFSVGIFAGCLLFSAFALQRSPRRVPLRC